MSTRGAHILPFRGGGPGEAWGRGGAPAPSSVAGRTFASLTPLHRTPCGSPPLKGRIFTAALLLTLAGCGGGDAANNQASPFPAPHRPVAPVSSRYLEEDARDRVGEFETVSRLAEVRERMFVADIGAGGGYYTVRLSPMVGPKGRVLAEDIVPGTIRSLSERITRERLDNVAVRLGQPNDPQLPAGSLDRIFMIHMYHEIERPAEFIWHMRASLKSDGRVIVVDADRPANQHGMPQRLLICEFNAVGYALTRFERLPDSESYFAQFEARGPRPEPGAIPACNP
ncbi:MAG TPA: methyltransferase domain-containing protein [Allosphingosinicella sp.]|nr:methyltransferase domain-containing protein [Allosphingosinicella sp.]